MHCGACGRRIPNTGTWQGAVDSGNSTLRTWRGTGMSVPQSGCGSSLVHTYNLTFAVQFVWNGEILEFDLAGGRADWLLVVHRRLLARSTTSSRRRLLPLRLHRRKLFRKPPRVTRSAQTLPDRDIPKCRDSPTALAKKSQKLK